MGARTFAPEVPLNSLMGMKKLPQQIAVVGTVQIEDLEHALHVFCIKPSVALGSHQGVGMNGK